MTGAGEFDGGVYVVLFALAQRRTIQVGRLGRFAFEPGTYAYAGSAQRGLAARLARHGRRRKPLRWHVDYLARHAALVETYAWRWPKRAECLLAEALAALPGAARIVPGFGASDCRCAGHVVRLEGGIDARRVAREVEKALGTTEPAKRLTVGGGPT